MVSPTATGMTDATSSTRAGRPRAAEPITTRAIPPAASAAASAGRAHTPTGLDSCPAGHREAGRDRDHQGTIARLAAAGGVEIDDVDPPRPLLAERRRDRHRVVAVHGLVHEVTLPQPDDRPPRRSIAGYSSIVGSISGSGQRDEVGEKAPSGRGGLLRMELGGEHVPDPERDVDHSAIVARGHHRAGDRVGTGWSGGTK